VEWYSAKIYWRNKEIGVKAIIVYGRAGSCGRNIRMMRRIACLQQLFFPQEFSKNIGVVEGCWDE